MVRTKDFIEKVDNYIATRDEKLLDEFKNLSLECKNYLNYRLYLSKKENLNNVIKEKP